MPQRQVGLAPGECYHLYNRGHGGDAVFLERENYLFFLRRVREYLLPVAEVLAYCLMPTHYHLLVRVRRERIRPARPPRSAETSEVWAEAGDRKVTGKDVSQAMMRLGVSYTKAVNKRYERFGTLFQGPFQARHVATTEYLAHLSRYIQLNPVLAGRCAEPEDWEFSSYREYLGQRSGTLPSPGAVVDLFGSAEGYRRFVEAYAPEEECVIAELVME